MTERRLTDSNSRALRQGPGQQGCGLGRGVERLAVRTPGADAAAVDSEHSRFCSWQMPKERRTAEPPVPAHIRALFALHTRRGSAGIAHWAELLLPKHAASR